MLEEVLTRSKVEKVPTHYTTITFAPYTTMTPYLEKWAQPRYIRPTDYYCGVFHKPDLFSNYNQGTNNAVNHGVSKEEDLMTKVFAICREHILDHVTEQYLWSWHTDDDGIVRVYVRKAGNVISLYDRHGWCSTWTAETLPADLLWFTKDRMVAMMLNAVARESAKDHVSA
jgi:hypothetical protein